MTQYGVKDLCLSGNGLSPVVRRQAITWNNVDTLSIGALRRHFSEFLIKYKHYHGDKANLRDLITTTDLVILLGSNRRIFGQCDLEIWMTSKNNKTHLLYYMYVKLCASFEAIGEFKLEFQSRNAQFGSKLVIFLSRVTAKFDGWPWKTIGHLFYAISSFVHHLKAIGEFKLELESGKAQFGSNRRFSVPRDREIWWMTFKTIGHRFYATSSFVHHFIAICEFKTGVTVRKRPIWVKIDDFFVPSAGPWNLTDDLEKH